MTKLRKGLSALLLSAFMTLGVGIGIGAKNVVEGRAATTVEMSTFTATSGNVGNDANITYEAQKGNASTNPAVNSNQIRIYQNGGLLVLNAKNDNYFTNITIGSAMATSISYTTNLNASSSSKSSIAQGGKYSLDLSKNETTVTFKCEGTSKTARLYLNYLSVTYDSGTGGTEPVARTLESINLSGTENIEFYKDDTFNHDSVKVTAHYSEADVEDRDVTSQATFSTPDMTTVGTKTVEVSYTEGEVTLTASYDITVKEYVYTGDGTLENPFTVGDAIVKAKEVGTTATTDYYYVKGTIATKKFYSNNYTLTFQENGATFTFYMCYADVNTTEFKSDILNVGDEVIGVGKIINYKNNTPELNSGCYIYDYKATGITASEPTNSGFAVGQTIKVADLGITVTADIEITGEKRDVTSEAKITNGLPLIKGDNTLTISYTQTNKYSGKTTNNTELTTTVVLKNVVQKAETVKVTASSDFVNIGETISLTAEVLPNTTDDKTVVWSSMNVDIATVDENTGVVTGVKVGKASIKATCGDVFGIIEIEVKDPNLYVDTLVINGTPKDYFVGEKFDAEGLTVSGIYSDNETTIDVTNDVRWSVDTFTSENLSTQVNAIYTNSIGQEITEPITIKVAEKVLLGISIEQKPTKLTYTTDNTMDDIDLAGMQVVALYDNVSRFEDVTNQVSIEGTIDFSKLGKQLINIAYNEDENVVTESFEINISLANMAINIVSGDSAPAAYEKVTQNLDDWSGEYAIVREEMSLAFIGVDAADVSEQVTIVNNKISSVTVSFILEKIDGTNTYSIRIKGGDNDGKYITYNANSNGISFGNSPIGYNVTFTTDCVDIASAAGSHLRYNGQAKYFRFYKASSYTSQGAIQLFKLTGGQTTTEYAVSPFLYETIQEADAALVCGNSSTGTWVDGTYDVATAKKFIELLETADLEALKSAQANENGNLVEKFLWKYDYLVATGKIENFLNRSVVSQARINPFITNANSETTIAIIVVISLVAVSSIGGYLFIRKRKEQ